MSFKHKSVSSLFKITISIIAIDMNPENKFQQIEHENSNAVISFTNKTAFKINNLMETINSFFSHFVLSDLSKKLQQTNLGTPPNHGGSWMNGVDAEILEPQSGKWQKGKIRMKVILEFCPDEIEEVNNVPDNNNSLDDIRQTITQ